MLDIKQILGKSENIWPLVEVLEFRENRTHILLWPHVLNFNFWFHEPTKQKISQINNISVPHFDIFKEGRTIIPSI